MRDDGSTIRRPRSPAFLLTVVISLRLYSNQDSFPQHRRMAAYCVHGGKDGSEGSMAEAALESLPVG